MITGYEYRKINDEKILILYLNYDIEFGIDFNNNHKHSNMKNEIKKYLKNNKIKLDGEKIALSFGGIILALLLVIEPPTQNSNIEFKYVSDSIIKNEIVEIIPNKENVFEKVNEELKQEIVKDEVKYEKSKEKIKNEQILNNKETINDKKEVVTNDQTSEVNKQKENNEIKTNEENSKQELITYEKPVTIYRNNNDVITLELEEYLIGVVGAEMPASFSMEALKAQAIISRTYALKKIENNEKLTDTVSTQRYKDNNELKKDWGNSFDTYYKKIKIAVESTKGLAIYYQNNLIDAVYHSTSNGKTEDAINVWKNDIPYLKSVDSTWDKDATSYLREETKDFNNILTLFGISKDNNSLEILSRNDSGRVSEIKIGDKVISGVEFREMLGLRSTDFDLELENNNLKITTRGYGHGVGLSQYGANGMSKQGYNYEQIIKHYYNNVNIK